MSPESGHEKFIPFPRELDAYKEMLWLEEGSDMTDDLSWEVTCGLFFLRGGGMCSRHQRSVQILGTRVDEWFWEE